MENTIRSIFLKRRFQNLRLLFLVFPCQIQVRGVTEGDAFLILASDGVWEFMENQEVRFGAKSVKLLSFLSLNCRTSQSQEKMDILSPSEGISIEQWTC